MISSVTAFHRCSIRLLQNLQENIYIGVSLNKAAGLQPVALLKKTSAQLFPSEFCDFRAASPLLLILGNLIMPLLLSEGKLPF